MKTTKRVFAGLLAVIMIFCMFPVLQSQAATVTLKNTTTKAGVYVGQTLTLKVKGTSKVTWKSSNTMIAFVNKKGVVTGKKVGNCIITATVNKTKKVYTCNLSVKKQQTLNLKQKDFYISTNGWAIGYCGKNSNLIKNASLFFDGVKLTPKFDTNGDGDLWIMFENKVSDGSHTFTIKKAGYKDFTVKLDFESQTYSGIFIDECSIETEDGIPYLVCILNPELEEKNAETIIKLDGKEISTEDLDFGLNGDGILPLWIDISSYAKGEHTISITYDGTEESQTFVIE
jgi:ribosomal protein L28